MNPVELQWCEEFKRKFLAIEEEVHFDKSTHEVEAFFGGFVKEAVYEDGLATRNYRDFEEDDEFKIAYDTAVKLVNHGVDPHIRWRSRMFEYFLRRQLPGRSIELGSGRGFLMHFALNYMYRCGVQLENSEFFLVDKFDSQRVDPKTGRKLATANSQYPRDLSSVSSNFVSFPQVRFVKGWLPETLYQLNIDFSTVRFVHIDLNSADSEVSCLEFLVGRVSKHCVIVLDDYGFPEYSESKARHRELSRQIGFSILSLPTGQGLIQL